MRRALLLSLPLAVLSSLPAAAQIQIDPIDGDEAAYLALTATPAAAFAPVGYPVRFGEPGGPALSFRYGHVSLANTVRNLGLTGDFPASSGRVGVTLGAAICDGCDPLIMLGGEWATPLVRRSSEEGAVAISLATAVGFGLPTTDAEGFALASSLGLSFSAVGGKANGPWIIPYVTPGLGFGLLTGDEGGSGIRPMIGGGLGFAAAQGFGVSAGFQSVPVEGGEMVVGLAVTIGRR